MAATKPINQPFDDVQQDVKAKVLATNVVIPLGTLACLDGANGAKPLTDTLMQAGSTFLGVARGTYDNVGGGAPVTINPHMLYGRATGATFTKAKGGDVPTVAMIGKAISMQDNETVKATIAGTDVQVILVDTDGSTFWRVRLP